MGESQPPGSNGNRATVYDVRDEVPARTEGARAADFLYERVLPTAFVDPQAGVSGLFQEDRGIRFG